MTPPPRHPRSRRRTAAALAAVALLGGAAGGAWVAATAAADAIEEAAGREVRLVLSDGFPWASVATDGLRVALSGTAPDEGARLRAIAAAGTAVDPGRVDDRIEVARAAPLAPPEFRLELLRSDAGLSLIGLVPAESAPERLAGRLRATGAGPAATDLLETADYPPPEGWREALGFALAAVAELPQAKIAVVPGRVAIAASAESTAGRDALETRLNRARPEGVTLDLDITAPRPVISPFALRFAKDAGGARLGPCAADSEAAQGRILDAARAAGAAAGAADCPLGLGAPTPDWAGAAVPAIAAVAALGAGSVALSDGDITLRVPAAVAPDAFDAEMARLRAALPPVFRLAATREAGAGPVAEAPPPDFRAILGAGGRVTLQGRVPDQPMRDAVESFARSRFAAVESALRVDPAVPGGWTVRVIAGLESMAGLASGSVEVTPEAIRLEGVSGSPTASDAAVEALAGRLGAGAHYALGIRYEPRLDPALGLPGGEECVTRANEAMAGSEIGFEPNSAAIEGDVAPSIAALKDALENCGDFRIELGGHTDSQGSEGFNQRLSQQRAEAVLAALAAGGVDTAQMTARGYGESLPVASNDSEAGREANRRIEFRLLADEPAGATAPRAATIVTGVTGGPAPAPAAPAETGFGLPFVPLPPTAEPPRPGPTAADIAAAPVPVGPAAAAETVPNADLGFAAPPPSDYTVARPAPRPPS